MNGWIGVDFDGTLAYYDKWVAADHCGEPVAPMVERVKAWLAEGREVRVFTARVWPITQVIEGGTFPLAFTPQAGMSEEAMKERCFQATVAASAMQAWCKQHIGLILPITCVKDYAMIELYDDRCVQVQPNTGRLIGYSTRSL